MMKRLTALLAMVAVLCLLVGCGAEKPAATADKSIQGYAELYLFGKTDNLAATGMTQAQADQITKQVEQNFSAAFGQYPLSDANVKAVADNYVAKMKPAMNIKTELVKDDDEHPVVKVSAALVDQSKAAQMAANNEDMLLLATVIGQLRAQGATDEEFKSSAEFQEGLVQCINRYVDQIPLTETKSLEVKCKLARGDDGQVYWAPENVEELLKFLGAAQ